MLMKCILGLEMAQPLKTRLHKQKYKMPTLGKAFYVKTHRTPLKLSSTMSLERKTHRKVNIK